MTETKKTGWVKKRSDGKHELVKSVRKPGKKNPSHRVVMQLQGFATVEAAYAHWEAESKALCRKGEGQANAKARRTVAERNVLILSRFMPKPVRVVPKLDASTLEHIGQAEEKRKAEEIRKQEITKLKTSFALKVNPMPAQWINADTQRRENESIKQDIAKMWAVLKWQTFEEALEALQKAGVMARDIVERSAHYKKHYGRKIG